MSNAQNTAPRDLSTLAFDDELTNIHTGAVVYFRYYEDRSTGYAFVRSDVQERSYSVDLCHWRITDFV